VQHGRRPEGTTWSISTFAAPSSSGPRLSRPDEVRLVPLEIGRLDADLLDITGSNGRVLMPVPAWLIEHPKGLVLFDTGLHADLRNDRSRLRGIFESAFTIDLPDGEDLTARLSAAGYATSDIDVVVFSHLHFDHCGGTQELPDARLIVQEAEWRAAHHPRLLDVGLYNLADFELGHDHQLIDGTHDVFGDGTITCIPTPGHTRGHQSLRVELGSGPVVLTADCIYFRSMYDQMKVPPTGADLAAQLNSMRDLRKLEHDGCRLLFGHDAEQFHSLPAGGLS
jgi:N-acyl homoserine lactone hydrolase